MSARDLTSELNVLHVVPSYYPATVFGGPIFSTKAICDGVSDHPDVQLSVLTTDAGGPKRRDRLRPKHNPDLFPAGYEVRYCRRIGGASISPELLWRLPRAVAWADVVHLTATYSFPTLPTLFLCKLLGRPVVWSPRGALQATSQWADAPRRSVKMAFERVAQALRPRRTVLLVTSPMERETSCERLPGIATEVIANSISLPQLVASRKWCPAGRLRLMFLSRLHEKKGLEVLLHALALLPKTVTLDVYGTGTDEYQASLAAQVERCALGDRVVFHGHVDGPEKTRAFENADLFCLPTWSENFGIVVGEALAHGVPVITTTAAPWKGLETEGCGLWIAPGPEPLLSAIRSLDGADLAAMGARGRDWIARDFSPEVISGRVLDLYRAETGRASGNTP